MGILTTYVCKGIHVYRIRELLLSYHSGGPMKRVKVFQKRKDLIMFTGSKYFKTYLKLNVINIAFSFCFFRVTDITHGMIFKVQI